MKAILSADLNWGIGYRGKLLQRVPEDMKYFMKMTMGKVVVMGRETFESLPGKQPLKDRINIVLSKNKDYGAGIGGDNAASDNGSNNGSNNTGSYNDSNAGNNNAKSYNNSNAGNKPSGDERLMICHSFDELFERLKEYSSEDIFVIGGQSIYTQLLPYCSEAYVTRFEKAFEADRHFPDLDRMENWELVEEGSQIFYNDMGFKFLKYSNKAISKP